jgi:hypothetical protein
MKLLSVLGQAGKKNFPKNTPPEDYSRRGLTIIEVIEDKKLFGPLFRNQETWRHWKVFLKGLFGLGMDEEEGKFFFEHTGRTTAPAKQFSECFCIAGRRAGKSFISALVASFLAIFRDWSPYLSAGEEGYIFIVAADKQQARVILNYVKAIFRLEPFGHLVEKELQTELRLTNNITIEVRTASFRTIRGYTVLAAILDELAFWRDENSANPAGEILTAILPALATIPNSVLLGISTPYAKAGPLYEAYREFFGKDYEDIPLIWKASTQTMNPVFRESAIRRFFERDKAAARSEYDAEFREDLESYMPLELIESITVPERAMLPPEQGKKYFAFTDVSGGRQDSFTLGISHKEGEMIIVDRLEEIKAPVPKPQDAVKDFCEILHGYQLTEVTGDRYGGNWSSSEFRKNGIRYVDSKLDKNEIYLQFQAVCSMHRVQLLDSERLRVQLQQLERRTRAGGKDSVDHPEGSGLHDDLANSCAGAAVLAFARRVWTEAEQEAFLPVAIKSERAERIMSEMRGEDYEAKKREQSAAEEMDEWMRGQGCSRIVKK